eukprot:scaffold199301_cov33-Cyclotella_meneghiniana.AAC.3
MAKEGIEVIQANNRRVAAAKKAAAWAAQNLQAAKEAAHQATEELKDAEKAQEAALKKWEVVDLVEVDKDREKPMSSNASKKRAGESSDLKVNASKKVKSDSLIPEEITVEGCGVAELNGIYKRVCNYCGAPKYLKEGRWKGEYVWFVVYFRGCRTTTTVSRHWSIGIRAKRGNYKYFYRNQNTSFLPPSDGWVVYLDGVEPTPKITVDSRIRRTTN